MHRCLPRKRLERPMQDHAYLARQPIVDNQQKIIGYELLFRRSAEATNARFTMTI